MHMCETVDCILAQFKKTNRNFIPLNCVLVQPNTKCTAGELFCGTKIFHNLSPFVTVRTVLCLVLLSTFCKKKWDWLHYWIQVRHCFTQVLVVEPLVPLFWISDNVSSGFSIPEWINHLHVESPAYNGFLRFTSGAASTNLLTANLAAELFWSTCFLDN